MNVVKYGARECAVPHFSRPGLGQVSGPIPHSQASYLELLCGLFEHPWGEGSEARPVSTRVFEYTYFMGPQAV